MSEAEKVAERLEGSRGWTTHPLCDEWCNEAASLIRDLEKERDRYRRALEHIVHPDQPLDPADKNLYRERIARSALHPNTQVSPR